MTAWILLATAAVGLILAAVRPKTPLRELPLLLPLSQLALVALGTVALLHRNLLWYWVGHLALMTLLGGLSDWLLLRMFRRIRRRQTLQHQVDALERELKDQEQRSQRLLAEAEDLRRLRHDFHNQLQTAALLLERGAAEEAQALLAQLRAFLEPSPEENGGDLHVQHPDL